MQFTIAELTNKNKADIKAAVAAKLDAMTEKEAIEKLTGIERVTDNPVIKRTKDGDLETREQVTRDILGAVIGSQRMEWTYYPNGVVDEIVTIELDAKGKEIERTTIKHYTDGRQPTVTINWKAIEDVPMTNLNRGRELLDELLADEGW